STLLNLARMGDLSAIQERAEHIKTLGSEYIPYAERLCALARGFEEVEVLHLIQQALEMKP
ncbi:MAG: hypothetical protein V2A34_14280, partial [Lentisphaerota bacterium]